MTIHQSTFKLLDYQIKVSDAYCRNSMVIQQFLTPYVRSEASSSSFSRRVPRRTGRRGDQLSYPQLHQVLTDFWATVCKTVRPMLSDRCLSVLSVLSITLVHCSQTVRWIKMSLGMEVGLDSGHTVLDGNSSPPQKGTAPPIFGLCLLWPSS